MVLLFGMLIFVPSICTAGAMASGCAAPPSGMVSWWGGDNTALDIMGVNNGTLKNGATFSPSGMVGQAFSFDGVDDYVQVDDSATLRITNQITIDAWIKPSSLGGRVVDKILAGGGNGYLLDTYGSRIRFIVDSMSVNGGTSLTPGVWTHIAATYDGSSLKVYLNGVLDGTFTPASPPAIPTNNLPLRIGADSNGSSLFTGLIDEVEIFNRALSVGEISALHNAGSAGKCRCTESPSGLTNWWGGDNNALDMVGGKNGMVYGTQAYDSGKVGQGFKFSGNAANYISTVTPLLTEITNTFSMSFWAKPGSTRNPTTESNTGISGINSQQYVIFPAHGDALAPGIDAAGVGVSVGTNGISVFEHSSNYLPSLLVHNASLSSTEWTHITVVYTNKTPSLYINGAYVKDGMTSSKTTVSPSAYIGGSPQNYGPYNGMVDEVSVYNRALTTAEIAAIYTAGSAGLCRSCMPPPTGLTSWWSGDENVLDKAGTNNGVLYNGASYSAGKIGPAFSFNGDGYVDLGDGFADYTGGFSAGFWANPSAASGSWARFIDLGNGLGDNNIMIARRGGSPSDLVFEVYGYGPSGPSRGQAYSPGAITNDEWHYYTVTQEYPTGTVKFYKDGLPLSTLGSSSVGYPYNIARTSNYLGKSNWSWDGYYVGSLDEVALFNRVITADEIAAIYNAGNSGMCAVHYVVSFDSNGGSAVGNQSVLYNGTATEPPAPASTGYTFSGWYADSGLSTAFSFATPITSDITLYAKWTLSTYTVSFNSTGGSAVSSQTVDYNATASQPTAPTRTGYTFSGWYADSGLTTAFVFSTPITSNITLYAKWTINTYTVSFESNGGSAVGSQTVNFNATATEPPEPTRTGYNFVAWYAGVSMVTPFDFATPITGPIKLYAKWADKTYKVSIVSGVGSSAVPANHKDVEYGDKAIIKVTPDPGYGILSISGCDGTSADNTTFTTGPVKRDCSVVVTAVKRSGNDGTAASPTVADALKVYLAYAGTSALTAEEKIRYDVAPLDITGVPKGNGVIDIYDVFMILRRGAGVGSW
jgi:uncharacterized repeat protein (TIGR02543 family)